MEIQMKTEERKCKECGNKLKGRSDKKFCDDYCRNSYNYRSLKSEHSQINRIHSTLKRNRKILKLFLEAGQREVQIELLKINGFKFNFVTQIQKAASNNPVYCCYDVSYAYIDDKKIKLLT